MLSHKMDKEEKWIPTSCNGCFNCCAILVKVKDNKVIEIKGDPAVTSSRGKVCGKSIARIADLYAPNRITKPLKRTNPEKGIGVDPKWVEISWEEAMNTVIKKLREIHQEDPRQLVLGHFDLHNSTLVHAFGGAYGTPNCEYFTVSCGNGLHTVFEITVGGVNLEIDLDRCNYMLLWGSQLGHGVNNNPMAAARDMANARRRGAKLVVIDPICGHAAAKADEWIPILPGTDAALALGMLNVLVNDLGVYDREYLKEYTNSPYLIDDTGHYVRDKDTGKPLVWDLQGDVAKVYDAEDIRDAAIEGTFSVDGVQCRPAFDLIKEHVKKNYPLDKVSRITTIPEKTIFRLAKEFGESACIGSTITIGGERLPFRPAAIEFKKGPNQHKNSFFSCFSLMLLNIVVGNVNVPGGVLGTSPIGPLNLWDVIKSEDGLMKTTLLDGMTGGEGSFSCFIDPYPCREIKPPESVDYRSLFPLSGYVTTITTFVLAYPEKFKLPFKPKALILSRTNLMASTTDPKETQRALKNFEFILGFGMKVDETLEFADIILPEAHDLERDWLFPANLPAGFIKPGQCDWYLQVQQAVVDPPSGVRNWMEVLIDIAEELGILEAFNNKMNLRTGLYLFEHLALEPNKKYTVREMAMRSAEMVALAAGKEFSPDIFTDRRTFLSLGEKSIQQAYIGPFRNRQAKVPVYFEHFIDAGKKVREVTKKMGMDWWDVSLYKPIPDWRPCPAYEESGEEYDLFLANGKLPLHYQTVCADNPWINDICTHNRLDYNILLNTETARKKGIQDGDIVYVESKVGKVKGKVRVTGCVHPQVVGTLGTAGHWAEGKPIAKRKGISFNRLVPFDINQMGMLSGQMDNCARVRIYKEK